MKAVYLYDLTGLWYEVINHFNEYLQVEPYDDDDDESEDEIIVYGTDYYGNMGYDLAMHWLSLKIHEITGGFDHDRINWNLEFHMRMSIRYDNGDILRAFTSYLKSTITPCWSSGTNIKISTSNNSLIIRTL